MNKKRAFAYLAELEKAGIVLGLDRIKRFLGLLGNPEKKFRAVHVAGTNGKGSTAAMIESVLRHAKYKTALYTSPHLVKLNERIKVSGREISDRELVKLVSELKKKKEIAGLRLTHFEFLTALAFEHFARCGIDFAVVEVGMGGRLDATNVLTPRVSVITNVEKEHERFLGSTVEKIAAEKAGIIKERVLVITAERKKNVLKIFKKACKKKNAKMIIVKKPFSGKVGLKGFFQKWNAAAAIAAISELQSQGFCISKKAIREGIANAKWPGRLEIVQRNPIIILDCCHNPSGATALARAFKQIFLGKKAVLVIGISDDKDVAGIVSKLSQIARFAIATEAAIRATPASKMLKEFEKKGISGIAVKKVRDAVKKGIEIAGKKGIVLATGSCFVVGEAMNAGSKSN